MKKKMSLIEAYVVKIVNGRAQYLILKRAENEKYPKIWQPVTGHIKRGEKAYIAAVREIEEETGFKPNKIYVVPQVNHYYNSERDAICEIPVFLCFVEDDFSPKLSSEHSEYMWAIARKAKSLFAWKGQRQSIEVIEEYLNGKGSRLYFMEIDLEK